MNLHISVINDEIVVDAKYLEKCSNLKNLRVSLIILVLITFLKFCNLTK